MSRPAVALAALAILGASGAAIAYFTMAPQQPLLAAANSATPPLPAPPVFQPIEAFTVTLNHNHTERLLHVGLTLELTDEASRKRVLDLQPLIRSQVLVLLGEQDFNRVQTSEGKHKLAADLRQAINAVFEGRGYPPVNKVLFNAFVVQ